MLPTSVTNKPPIRVVVIEDERELRDGLRALLDFTPEFTCVGCFAAMEDALAAINTETADLILTDIGLPKMNGIEGYSKNHVV